MVITRMLGKFRTYFKVITQNNIYEIPVAASILRKDTYETVKPYLESISPNICHCGDIGNGHVAKLVNNTIAACKPHTKEWGADRSMRQSFSAAWMQAAIQLFAGGIKRNRLENI